MNECGATVEYADFSWVDCELPAGHAGDHEAELWGLVFKGRLCWSERNPD